MANNTAVVFESQISINGEHVVAGLKGQASKLAVGTILSSEGGKQWKVAENNLTFLSKDIMLKIKEAEQELVFFYDLNPLGHSDRPKIGELLTTL